VDSHGASTDPGAGRGRSCGANRRPIPCRDRGVDKRRARPGAGLPRGPPRPVDRGLQATRRGDRAPRAGSHRRRLPRPCHRRMAGQPAATTRQPPSPPPRPWRQALAVAGKTLRGSGDHPHPQVHLLAAMTTPAAASWPKSTSTPDQPDHRVPAAAGGLGGTLLRRRIIGVSGVRSPRHNLAGAERHGPEIAPRGGNVARRTCRVGGQSECAVPVVGSGGQRPSANVQYGRCEQCS
jgi:hypothetical protein